MLIIDFNNILLDNVLKKSYRWLFNQLFLTQFQLLSINVLTSYYNRNTPIAL